MALLNFKSVFFFSKKEIFFSRFPILSKYIDNISGACWLVSASFSPPSSWEFLIFLSSDSNFWTLFLSFSS